MNSKRIRILSLVLTLLIATAAGTSAAAAQNSPANTTNPSGTAPQITATEAVDPAQPDAGARAALSEILRREREPLPLDYSNRGRLSNAFETRSVAVQQDDFKTQQEILAQLKYEKRRADLAEKNVGEIEQQRDQWKELYQAEKNRAGKVEDANAHRQTADGKADEELAKLKTQAVRDAERIRELETALAAAQKGKIRWGTAGLLLGIGIKIFGN